MSTAATPETVTVHDAPVGARGDAGGARRARFRIEDRARRTAGILSLLGPVALVYLWILGASLLGGSIVVQAQYALASLVMVIGLQLFVGTSGILSFGHVAFVAVGAFTYALAQVPPDLKASMLPGLFPFLQDLALPWWAAVALAGVAAAALAAIVGPFLMRAEGLQAGIATFAPLLMTQQVLTYWRSVAPPSGQSFVGIPDVFGLQTLLWFALAAIVLSWLYQRTRTARLLRATREAPLAAPASGVQPLHNRMIALVLSAAMCGVGGALWAETNRVVSASQLGIGMTFTLLAMLVLGGRLSMWGAVAGTMVYSILDSALQFLQRGVEVAGWIVWIPEGARLIFLGALLVIVLLFLPEGLTGGRRFGIGFVNDVVARRRWKPELDKESHAARVARHAPADSVGGGAGSDGRDVRTGRGDGARPDEPAPGHVDPGAPGSAAGASGTDSAGTTGARGRDLS